MQKGKQMCTFVCFVFCLSIPIFAKTYLVTPNGANPSILESLRSASPGDTVLVGDGVYAEEEIKIEDKKGTNSKRLVLKALHPGKVKLFSPSKWHVISVWRCTGLTIEGFEVTYNTAKTSGIWNGIYVTDCEWVTIKNNFVHDCGLSGIQVDKSDNILVENNRCVSNASRNELNGSGISFYHPIAYSTSPSGFGIIVRGNTCTRNVCDIPFKGYPTPTDGNGIILDDYNNTQGGGQQGGYQKKSLVENNICYNNGGRGIHVFLSNNAVVRNNTIWHNNYQLQKYYTFLGDLSFTNTDNSIASNNIVVFRPENKPGHALWIEGKGNIFINNILIGTVKFQNSSGSLDKDGSSKNQQSTDQNFAKFINPTTDTAKVNFRLTKGSPGIDKGNATQFSEFDILGNQRPSGTGIDIGAYEFDQTNHIGFGLGKIKRKKSVVNVDVNLDGTSMIEK